MAGVASEEAGAGRSTEGSGQRYQAGELAEWRSSEQVENGTPSTSPPYWDTDDEDDGGLKPSELYGKYTWKIEKFSQTNKRELRSNAFEVGGYKWYILIYPQGCDVCNHLSLFLCVSNHDKLLPGWSHFAQFTIAVVNKDPKKSKYSDTLHRFWKKEHDWGWKKFMELSKVSDGFLDAADTLIIKAQVQVIREKAERPFRCLDCHYRRELVRVYLTNVEQICRRFVEERRGKLGRLIEDKNRWSSFCSFWLGMDQNSRRRMSREKADVVLKVVVKNFFIEKEVTSTLVMDSLYSGLKALQGQNQTKSKKGRAKVLDAEEMPAPIVRMEKDMFVLVDDVLLLLERAAKEPLPPKDEKGPQNRTKDGNSGEDFSKDLIERDERRLTELGRRTVEIFVLSHIFNNKIEVAHQEAVALKRQEELIREEAEWLAESEQKGKRGASEKEKKSKKKQAKQKRNNRKGKDKGKEDNAVLIAVEKDEEPDSGSEKTDSIMGDVHPEVEKPDIMEEASEMSDSVDGASEVIQPDSEDREVSPVNWDTDTSEAHPPTEACSSGVSGLSSVPNGTADKKSTSAMDDSSSTCSTDSVPSVVMNGPYKGSSYSDHHSEKSPGRGKNQRTKVACDTNWTTETDNNHSELTMDAGTQNDGSESGKTHESEFAAAVHDLQDRITRLEQHVVKKGKEEEVVYPQKKLSGKDLAYGERHTKETRTATPPSPSSTPRGPKDLPPTVQMRSETKDVASVDVVQVRKVSSNSPQQVDKTVTSIASTRKTGMPKSEIQSTSTPKVSDRPVPQLQQQPQQPQPPSQPQPQKQPPTLPPQQPQTQPPQQPQQVPVMSRPSSAPLMPGPRPTAPVVTVVHSTPLLARSVSATGRLGPDPSATHSYVPQSYRNAIIGNSVGSSSSGFAHANIPPSSSGFAHANIPPSSSGFAHANIPPSSSGFAHANVPPSSSGFAHANVPPSSSGFAHANVPPSSSGFAHANVPPSSGGNFLPAHLQPATLVSSPTFLPQSSDRMEQNSVQTGFPFGMVTGDVLQNGSQWMDNSHRGTNRTAHSDSSLLTSSIQNLELYQPVPSVSQEQHFTDFSTRTASGQTQVVRDEYPHLDIINDLLDDEQVIGNAAGVNRVFQPLNNGPHLDRQYTFPCDVGVSGDSGPSNGSSSCRFDRMRSYHDGGFQRAYSTSGAHFDGIREFVPQARQLSYANGHNDVMVPNQWQIGGSDLSMAGLSNAEGDGSQYFNPEYSNLQCGVNGYTVYRPSNGH